MRPPPRWMAVCHHIFQCRPPLARDLWRALRQTEPQACALFTFQLSLALDRPRSPASLASCDQFFRQCSPQLLFGLCLSVAPENGHPRRRDVVHLEERLCTLIDQHGGWLSEEAFDARHQPRRSA